jgi:hypothetical protein
MIRHCSVCELGSGEQMEKRPWCIRWPLRRRQVVQGTLIFAMT